MSPPPLPTNLHVVPDDGQPSPAAGTHDVEVKLILQSALMDAGLSWVWTQNSERETEVGCFFDTDDLLLKKAGVILRAREKEGEPGEVTVKLTYPSQADAVADSTVGKKAEEDRISRTESRFSRSVDRADGLPAGDVAKLATGELPAETAFDASLRDVVARRLPGLDWRAVRAFGPVQAEIWKKLALPSFTGPVTAEYWKMTTPAGKPSDELLEISTKGKKLTDEALAALVEGFFSAAAADGFGESTGESKTNRVLKFFGPGTG